MVDQFAGGARGGLHGQARVTVDEIKDVVGQLLALLDPFAYDSGTKTLTFKLPNNSIVPVEIKGDSDAEKGELRVRFAVPSDLQMSEAINTAIMTEIDERNAAIMAAAIEQRVLVGNIIGKDTYNKITLYHDNAYITQFITSHAADPEATFENYTDQEYLGAFENALDGEDYNLGKWYYDYTNHTGHINRLNIVTNKKVFVEVPLSTLLPKPYRGNTVNDNLGKFIIQANEEIYFNEDTRTLRQATSYTPGQSESIEYRRIRLLDTRDLTNLRKADSDLNKRLDVEALNRNNTDKILTRKTDDLDIVVENPVWADIAALSGSIAYVPVGSDDETRINGGNAPQAAAFAQSIILPDNARYLIVVRLQPGLTHNITKFRYIATQDDTVIIRNILSNSQLRASTDDWSYYIVETLHDLTNVEIELQHLATHHTIYYGAVSQRTTNEIVRAGLVNSSGQQLQQRPDGRTIVDVVRHNSQFKMRPQNIESIEFDYLKDFDFSWVISSDFLIPITAAQYAIDILDINETNEINIVKNTAWDRTPRGTFKIGDGADSSAESILNNIGNDTFVSDRFLLRFYAYDAAQSNLGVREDALFVLTAEMYVWPKPGRWRTLTRADANSPWAIRDIDDEFLVELGLANGVSFNVKVLRLQLTPDVAKRILVDTERPDGTHQNELGIDFTLSIFALTNTPVLTTTVRGNNAYIVKGAYAR